MPTLITKRLTMMIWLWIVFTLLMTGILLRRRFYINTADTTLLPSSLTSHPTRVKLVPQIEALVLPFQQLAGKKGVTLTLEFDLCSDVVMVDEMLLRQIVNALLENVLSAPLQGDIGMLVYQLPGRSVDEALMLAIEITDSGVGRIPKNGTAQFKHSDGTDLAHYQSLARLMGGEIYEENEPGEGSALCLYLPVKPYPSQALPSLASLQSVEQAAQSLSDMLIEKDPAAFIQIAQAVIESNDADIQNIRLALAKKNRDGLARLAHRQIGGARMLNAVPLEQACLKMQSEIKKKVPEWSKIAGNVEQVEQEIRQLALQLEKQTSALRCHPGHKNGK